MPGTYDRFGDAVRSVIRAYHGSPHNFDRFDASRIGTGEGAQAFGHGLYFAGDENVARHYRDNVRRASPEEQDFLRRETTKEKQLYRRQEELVAALEEQARRHGSPREGWGDLYDIPDTEETRAIRNSLRVVRADLDETSQKLLAAFQKIESRPGRMYEVQIDIPEQDLLDWDAPFRKQPPAVRRLYGDFMFNEPGDGGRIYRDASVRLGSGYDDDLTGMLGERDASQELLHAGIPGIRYLDGSSRTAGQGTRNYVLFPGTEDRIRILRKYGLLPATLGAEGLLNQQPEESMAPAF